VKFGFDKFVGFLLGTLVKNDMQDLSAKLFCMGNEMPIRL
jgi:hypothetical protein